METGRVLVLGRFVVFSLCCIFTHSDSFLCVAAPMSTLHDARCVIAVKHLDPESLEEVTSFNPRKERTYEVRLVFFNRETGHATRRMCGGIVESGVLEREAGVLTLVWQMWQC